MSEKATKIPQIRFDGYTDAWEQRKLGEIAERVQGNDGRMDLPTLTISAANGWMDQKERFSGNIAGKEQKKYTLLHKGELSYNHGNSKLAKYGTVFSLETYEEALVPRVYHSFKVINGSSKFIEYYFATKIPDRELAKLVSSGARMDGLLNINFNEFMGINLTVPNKSEQEKISNYFSNLDHLITLHQRECDLLAKMKKSYLQKMFPKNGEDKPEIRFDGYTDAWEQRKVDDVTTSYSGGTPQAGNSEYYNGTIPFIRSGEIYESHTELFITEKGLENSSAKMVSKGDILYALYGATSGEVSRSNIDGAINQAILAITPNDGYNADFLVEWFRKEKESIIDKYLQGGQGNLSAQIIKKLEIPFPTFEEQNKIGRYFTEIDNLITLHQRELDSLKKMKKSLLQMMFV